MLYLLLWFGYKKMYLWYSEQPAEIKAVSDYSCDLVTKKCIFDILNNVMSLTSLWLIVVIWLQKNVSLIFWTTAVGALDTTWGLWFGYKKMYLWYSEQQPPRVPEGLYSCDLVTKKCIFDILNNDVALAPFFDTVVIWLQKNVSLIFWTTSSFRCLAIFSLWFGYKKMYLWYSEQQHQPEVWLTSCCDLVTKKCIFDILNNFVFHHIPLQ